MGYIVVDRKSQGYQGGVEETEAASPGPWEAAFLGTPTQQGEMTSEYAGNQRKSGVEEENVASSRTANEGRLQNGREEPRGEKHKQNFRPFSTLKVPIPKGLLSSLESLWATILNSAESLPLSLLICGPSGGEGASRTSLHMALYSALKHGLRTVYVDLDVESKAKLYISNDDKEEISGFAGYCLHNLPLESIVKNSDYEHLWIVPSGGSRGLTLSTVVSQKKRLKDFFMDVNKEFDVVVIDAPPVLTNLGILSVVRFVDHALLACRYAQTRYEVGGLAAKKLQEAGAKRLAAILTYREYPVPPLVYRLLK